MPSTKLFNLVEMTVVGTPGAGTLTLGTATAANRFTFAEAGAVSGDVVTYVIRDDTNIEVGIGTYGPGAVLARDTVRLSKIAGVSGTTKISATSAAIVYVDAAAEDLANHPNHRGPLYVTQNEARTSRQGLIITQDGPAAGTTGGEFKYNTINADDRFNYTGKTNSFGLHVELDTGGPGTSGQKTGIRGKIQLVSAFGASDTQGDVIAVSGQALGDAPNGGTNTGAGAQGSLYGSELNGWALPGATNYHTVSGGEALAVIQTGASARNRWGWSIVGNGDLQGAVTDTALHFSSATVAGRWANCILLSNENGSGPLLPTGTVIGTDGSSNTITNGIDLSSYTITGNFLKGPAGAFVVSGIGAVTSKSLKIAASDYVNWGTTYGTTGYGIRDNAGTIEVKNSAGSWAPIGSGAGTGDMLGSVNLAQSAGGVANTVTARTNLGLGTAAVKNTGTSGSTVPLLDGANTWSAAQTITDATASTSTSTGALKITGGIGVGGQGSFGGAISLTNNVTAWNVGTVPLSITSSSAIELAISINNTNTGGHNWELVSTAGGGGFGSGNFIIYDFTAGGIGGGRFIINSSGQVSLPTSISSTSVTTGALVVAGGAGIDGAIYGSNTISAYSNLATPAAASAVAGLKLGAAGVGIYWGTGDPAFTAAKGSLYIKTDATTTTTRLWINTNASTTWTFTGTAGA